MRKRRKNLKCTKQRKQLVGDLVTMPKGFKEAYAQFVAGGWQGLSFPVEYGGQGMPMSLNLFKSEMMGAANWSFNMYPGLSIGCINTLLQYGTDAIKTVYLPRLVAGDSRVLLRTPATKGRRPLQRGTGSHQCGDANAAGAVSDGVTLILDFWAEDF